MPKPGGLKREIKYNAYSELTLLSDLSTSLILISNIHLFSQSNIYSELNFLKDLYINSLIPIYKENEKKIAL